ncbi:MAG: MurR/RpiR family transcriptional regulator [Firmicutes bacterium]|nr:MurR/RpiR family transcriptional regulator [Bacillota bacterium]
MPISGIIERIESNLDELTGSEAKVARWILSQPENVLRLTVRDLAREAKTSQAAVVRLCRTLKIDGYNTLKVLLTADLVRKERQSPFEYEELDPATSFSVQLQSFGMATEESVRSTLANINEDDLDRLGQRLSMASRILIYGAAASQVVALDLAQKLTRLGYPVMSWSDVHMASMGTAVLQSHDVAILVSFSGATREVLELATQIKQRGALLVGMTQFRPKNQLADYADIVFYVSAVEPTPRVGASTSVIASLVVSDALMLWLANRDPNRTLEYLKATEEAVRPHRH